MKGKREHKEGGESRGVEDSIRKGEPVKEGFGTSTRRETRLKEECGKLDMTFYPEDDWEMPERQGEDQRREEAQEAQREVRYPAPTFKTKPQWGNA